MLTGYKEVTGKEYTEFKCNYVQKTHRDLIFKEHPGGVYENYDGELLVAKVENGKYYILSVKYAEDDKQYYYKEMYENGTKR
jgi:hypothetical protein